MQIKFQGFNAFRRKIDSFELENCINFSDQKEKIDDLTDFYLTFDSIYYYSSKFRSIFVYDFALEHFAKLETKTKSEILRLSSNTNYLWTLSFDQSKKSTQLCKYSYTRLVEAFQIDLSTPLNDIGSLVLVSTDINVYIFENSSATTTCGLRLVYALNSFENVHSKKKKSLELKLNESSTCSLPLNKTLIKNERIGRFSSGKEHLLFVAERSKRVYAIGVGLKGQLGNGKIENAFEEPCCIDLSDVCAISSGGWHSGALNSKGDCFLWGWNASGQIGDANSNQLCSDFFTRPTQLSMRDNFEQKLDLKFRSISLGSRHSALVDSENNLYTFGWNKYNQLFFENENLNGDDSEPSVDEPTLVDTDEKRVHDVKCGPWYTLILTT